MQNFNSIGWQGAENEVKQASAYLGLEVRKMKIFRRLRNEGFSCFRPVPFMNFRVFGLCRCAAAQFQMAGYDP